MRHRNSSLAVGVVSRKRDSWITCQPPYIATAVAVETTENSSHNSATELTELSAIAAREPRISAAITPPRGRFIAQRSDSAASDLSLLTSCLLFIDASTIALAMEPRLSPAHDDNKFRFTRSNRNRNITPRVASMRRLDLSRA